jgi:magnesium transporter
LEITSEKSEFGDNNSRRIRYSITCLPALNLSRHFRRPTSECKKTPTDNLVQNSKNTLRRIARVRRLVTLLGRLLATKSEVIAQIRKRLLADRYFKVGAKSNLDALDIAMHMDDVQGLLHFSSPYTLANYVIDHIFTLQRSLAHYERMLGQLHPTYLSQLRTDLVITKSGESKAFFYLTSITVAVLCIQSYVGSSYLFFDSPFLS